MSVQQPDALALLDIARETLLEQVLPHLKGNARYQALMIANAMAMAMRELAPGAVEPEHEMQLLRDLYAQRKQPADEKGDDDMLRTLQRLEARFARDLRNGEFDGGAQQQVRQLLRARLEARLAVSNPRRLSREREGRADSGRSHNLGSGPASDPAPSPES